MDSRLRRSETVVRIVPTEIETAEEIVAAVAVRAAAVEEAGAADPAAADADVGARGTRKPATDFHGFSRMI
jgi:hypothetical protein